MKVAAVQLRARGVSEADKALEESLDGIERAARAGAELIVLPECTWPGYILGSNWRDMYGELPDPDEVMDRYAAAAAAADAVLVVGLALPQADRVFNAAVVWERDGRRVAAVRKRFLWDFDSRWFTPGDASPVVDTSAGRLGVFVCADGRMPEIARLLAVQGAEILLDPTAWVTAGTDPSTWTNPQFEYMLPTRARENGLPAVAANKVGFERNAVAYCGRSCILDARGERLAAAPSDGPDIAVADCTPAAPAFPIARRPRLYAALTRPTSSLRVAQVVGEAVVPSDSSARIAIDALDRELDADDVAFLVDAGTALLITPRVHPNAGDLLTLAADETGAAVLRDGGVILGRWQRTHGNSAPSDTLGPVVPTPAGNVAVMFAEDGLAPEVCRCLMLDGADVVVWFAGKVSTERVAATRAAENRVALCVIGEPDGWHDSRVIGPGGGVLAAAGDLPRMVTTTLSVCDTRRKDMAPGTDVVGGRQPRTYGALTTDGRESQ